MKSKNKINKKTPVILLLGGKGTRFSKLDQSPKQLVKLNKNSLIASILLYFKKYGLNHFILPLGFKGSYFRNFFNNKKNIEKYSFNILKNNKTELKNNCINIKIFNSNKNCSKLNRIKKSLKYFNEKNFIVTYGDGLANINFKKQLNYFEKIKCKNIVTVFKIRSQYGHVNYSKKLKVLSFDEKPYLNLPINIGYYVFNRFDFIKHFNKREELETKFLPRLVKKNLLSIYEHKGFFFNIDNKKDLEQVKNKFKGI